MSPFEPSLQVVRRLEERHLSSKAFVELLRAVVQKGALFRLQAGGVSMYPFICNGDVLTLAAANEIELGDVVAVCGAESGGLIVHRVVARCGEGLLVKGDFCVVPDGFYSPQDIAAKVVRVERGRRTIKAAPCCMRRLIARLSTARVPRRLRLATFKTLVKLGVGY